MTKTITCGGLVLEGGEPWGRLALLPFSQAALAVSKKCVFPLANSPSPDRRVAIIEMSYTEVIFCGISIVTRRTLDECTCILSRQ